MRYLLILAIWASVLVGSFLLSDYYPDNEGFFLVNSTIACVLCIVFLLIERSFLTFTLASFEISAILLCLFAIIGYKSDVYSVFYEHYEYFLASVNVLEGFVLIYKAPRHGFFNSHYRLRNYIASQHTVDRCCVELFKG